MARMVRKQIYIETRHERQLRRIAERRGVSQAEVVRDAIEREAVGSGVDPSTDTAAWEEALATIRKIHRGRSRPATVRRWTRPELYEDRLTKRANRTD
jgi:hypothetical protein